MKMLQEILPFLVPFLLIVSLLHILLVSYFTGTEKLLWFIACLFGAVIYIYSSTQSLAVIARNFLDRLPITIFTSAVSGFLGMLPDIVKTLISIIPPLSYFIYFAYWENELEKYRDRKNIDNTSVEGQESGRIMIITEHTKD